MASGRSATGEEVAISVESLSERLLEAPFVTIASLPHPAHLVAAAILARAEFGPSRIHVINETNDVPTKPEGLVIGTDPSIPGADVALSAIRPVEHAEEVLGHVDGEPIDGSIMTSVTTHTTSTSGGIVATHESLARNISTSVRTYGPLSGVEPDAVERRLNNAGLAQTVTEVSEDTTLGRRLASWLSTITLESDHRPSSASSAMERLFAPTYLADGPAPTAQGLFDLLWLAAATDAGLAVAAALDDQYWQALLDEYDTSAGAVHETVGSLPVDREEPLVVETVDTPLLEPVAWLWTAFRLDQPYGVLVREAARTRVSVASTGSRSASAMLEGVATGRDGVCWGDEAIAGGFVDADATTLENALRSEL